MFFRYCRNENTGVPLHPKKQRVVSRHVNPVVFMRLGHKGHLFIIIYENKHLQDDSPMPVNYICSAIIGTK